MRRQDARLDAVEVAKEWRQQWAEAAGELGRLLQERGIKELSKIKGFNHAAVPVCLVNLWLYKPINGRSSL